MNAEFFAAWLLTLAMHAGVLLVLAWAFDRSRLRVHLGWREWLWRLALFGGFLTSTAQLVLETPGPARFSLAVQSGQSAMTEDRSDPAAQATTASVAPARADAGPGLPALGWPEIGRASCRERV